MLQIDSVFFQILFYFQSRPLYLCFCRNNTNPVQLQIVTTLTQSEIKLGFCSICRLEIKMFELDILFTFTEQFLLLIDQNLFTLLSEIVVYCSYDRIIIFYFVWTDIQLESVLCMPELLL